MVKKDFMVIEERERKLLKTFLMLMWSGQLKDLKK